MTNIDPNMPMESIGGSSNYMTKADVPLPHGRLETMDRITIEDIKDGDGNKERMYVLHFQGDVPPLILRKAHTTALAEAGFPTAASVQGQQIVVYINPDVEFRGKKIGGIRVRKPVIQKPTIPTAPDPETALAMAEEQLAQQQQQQSDAEPPPAYDDDIPF